MDFDFDYDSARGSVLLRLLVFFFPAILLWLISMFGFVISFKSLENWIYVLIYWSLIEFFLIVYFLRGMKNKIDIIKRLFLNWGMIKLISGWVIPYPFGESSRLEKGLGKEDSYNIQYAGIAFFSMLIPFVIAILCFLALYILFSGLS